MHRVSRFHRKLVQADEHVEGNISTGGAAFIPPIISSHVLQPLLALLSPEDSSPQIVLAVLKALNFVANSSNEVHPDMDTNAFGLEHLLYLDQTLSTLTGLLLQPATTLMFDQQIILVADVISKTCRKEFHRLMLAQSGVLEALATELAPFVLATGKSLLAKSTDWDVSYYRDEETQTTRSPTKLASILEAINHIINNSQSRTIQFLAAPAFEQLFSIVPVSDLPVASSLSPELSLACKNGTMVPISKYPFKFLLPDVPSHNVRRSLPQTAHYPPIAAAASSGKSSHLTRAWTSTGDAISSQASKFVGEAEHPLIAWLIHVFRVEDGTTRLTAASMLATLYRNGEIDKRKDIWFSLLLVPLLVRMLDKELKPQPKPAVIPPLQMQMKEQAPAILAVLVDNADTQQAAVDANAIKKLSQLLKESYDPLPATSTTSLWSPGSPDLQTMRDIGDTCRLGPPGLSAMALHVLRVRESVLKALNAIASLKDQYRKCIIDNGVLPFIVESLKLSSQSSASSAASSSSKENSTTQGNNPKSVVLAACGAIRGLSRSVGTLRTSLMDAGLTAPIFVLLKHHDTELQCEATAAICNLVLEFSPMREVNTFHALHRWAKLT